MLPLQGCNLDVIRLFIRAGRCVVTDQDSVNIQLENNDHCSILELNVTLPGR
ncbi:hypothetical protein [Marinobacterium rhizophilum]|uniref:Uncharacterized protein n=1 Tax=Marinobacterium rhizophilum TaxID=420402 RepID=A0ABY5HMA5_9GAMM|nr:hypothetical protein [Marinobacterium rhizophilum]UTW13435.1 hypothetical protein KDW95_07245 [Marinobacterium rhizophilum]